MSSYPSGGGPSYTPGPGGPAYSPSGSSREMISQASIQDVLNSWMTSLTQPNVQTYANELARFSQNRLLISVGLATVAAAVLGLVGGIFDKNLVGDFVGALIGVPLSFFIGQGILYLVAKLFGGQGDYMQQAWVFSTFWAPVLIIQHVPFVGGLIGGLAGLYTIYLGYLALQPVHRLDSQKALFVILTLVAIVVVLAIIFTVLFAALFFTAAAVSR